MTVFAPAHVRAWLLALGTVACALLASGADDATARARAQTPAPALAWSACGGNFECATLQVPLDHGAPAGRHIGVALVRQSARDPARRIGALLMNPGGPGASGVGLARALVPRLAPELQDRFDLVGFDPRGVGDSTPLFCHDDIQLLAALEPEPRTPAQWAAVREATARFTALCAERGGELLAHIGSLDVVRDMDRIRAALGDSRISYLGYSYGTVLGALYIDRFPDRVRAFVLDGAVDLALSADELTATQAAGFGRAYDRFLENCRAQKCLLALDGADPAATIAALIARARQQPIPSLRADRAAGPGEAMLAVIGAMYSRRNWPVLTVAVGNAINGDGTGLVRLADALLGRQGEFYDNSYAVNPAVNCLDYDYSRDPAHYERLTSVLLARAPHFGAAFAPGGLTCALWPVSAQPIALLDAGRGAPPVLVIGTTNDPATPYEWALALRRALYSAVLLTYEGDGHTVYGAGNRCVDETVNAYFLTRATAVDGGICGAGDIAPRTPPSPPQGFVAPPVPWEPTAVASSADAPATVPEPPGAQPAAASQSTLGSRAWVAVAFLALALAGGAVVWTAARTIHQLRARREG